MVQYGPGIRRLVIVFWAAAVALTLIAIFEPLFPWWGRLWLIGSAVFIATVLHVEFFYSMVRYDAVGVHFISPWRADRLVAWGDFERAYYSDGNDAYVLESSTYGKMYLHKYLSGVDSLLSELAERGVRMELDNFPTYQHLQ